MLLLSVVVVVVVDDDVVIVAVDASVSGGVWLLSVLHRTTSSTLSTIILSSFSSHVDSWVVHPLAM